MQDWHELSAYVLLAEPGAGKTFAMEELARGAQAIEPSTYIKAIDFVSLPLLDEWRGHTLYIDGLDEMRVDLSGRGDPLHELRARLVMLGRPRFRLSCRAAEWRGAADREALARVAPDGRVAELTLEPLNADETRLLLGSIGTLDIAPPEFMRLADENQLGDLLDNPLLVDLLARATSGGRAWPRSKTEVFEAACREMAKLEVAGNPIHLTALSRTARPSLQTIQQQAGLLAATLLLSGADRFTTNATAANDAELPVADLPEGMRLTDPWATLRTGLFVGEAQSRSLRHRAIGEFLGAAAITAKTLESGVPFGRVLALMTGSDGGVVEPLRGTHAWLATRCPPERSQCIRRDPMGVLLYGDPKSLSSAEKVALFQALGAVAASDSQFPGDVDNWGPFGTLAIEELLPTFRMGLALDCREPGHVQLLACVLMALRHGAVMPQVAHDLDTFLRQPNRQEELRVLALRAWWRQGGNDAKWARQLLDEIASGGMRDRDDELCGHLLHYLFPQHMDAMAALGHLHPAKNPNWIGEYWWFWTRTLPETTPSDSRRDVLDRLASQSLQVAAETEHSPARLVRSAMAALLTAGLAATGDKESPERLYNWLGIGESDALEDDNIRAWIESRPALHLELLRHGLETAAPSASGEFMATRIEQRLRCASRKGNEFDWMLDIAETTKREDVARYCIGRAAWLSSQTTPGDDSLMVRVIDELAGRLSKWPQARQWVDQYWRSSLDDWRADDARDRRKRASEHEIAQTARRAELLPYLEALRAANPPAGLLHNLAMAHQRRLKDTFEKTPEGRIQEYLGGPMAEVAAAIRSIRAAPLRSDLPTPVGIFALAERHYRHLLHEACLLGASLSEQEGQQPEAAWSESARATMVAFWLVESANLPPPWFKRVAKAQPALVATLLVEYTALQYKARAPRSPSILWRLKDTPELNETARIALPDLLRRFPIRANAEHLGWLRNALLPAAVTLLRLVDLERLIQHRLGLRGLDDGQRVSWLALNVRQQSKAALERLTDYLGTSQARAAHLAETWRRLPPMSPSSHTPSANALALLIEVLAPHAPSTPMLGAGLMSDNDALHHLLRELIHGLAGAPPSAARQELRRLIELPVMESWRGPLEEALQSVTLAERANSFRYASVQQIARTLANGKPSNPRDLVELLIAQLEDTGRHLRGESTSQLSRFWQSEGQAWSLRSENECRDVLVQQLESKLEHLDVAITPESPAAFNKRTDFKAECSIDGKRVRVPVELKRQDHRYMWTAWRDQLDRYYTSDPRSSGLGLYVVLWWGDRVKSHSGQRPTNPKELEEALHCLMNRDQRTGLRAVVMDLSWPEGAKRPR